MLQQHKSWMLALYVQKLRKYEQINQPSIRNVSSTCKLKPILYQRSIICWCPWVI